MKRIVDDLMPDIDRELAEENRTADWKARMREAYDSGDVEQVMRLLRSVNRTDA